jgi:hypothetical protein
MLVNKAMLAGAVAVGGEFVLIEKDGTVVGISSNNAGLFVAEPIIQEVPFGSKDNLSDSIILPLKTAEELQRAIPRDTLFKGILEHADLSLSSGAEVKVETRDGRRSLHQTIRRTLREDYKIPWKEFLSRVSHEVTPVSKMIYNRKVLAGAIKALEAACKYDGSFSPVLVESAGLNKTTWRSINELTGQRVWIVFDWTQIQGKWPEPNAWEQSFLNKKPIIRRKQV